MHRLVSSWLRLVEFSLPIPFLVVLIFPAAAVIATRQMLIGNANIGKLRELAEAARLARVPWRRFSLLRIWIAQVAMCMARQTRSWPDKLKEPRWTRRCEFVGLDKMEAILAEGRSVVLATLHYGEGTELYHWLRSRGIGVAFLTTRKVESDQAYFNQFDLLANRLNGLERVPAFIPVGHLRLWQALDFLCCPARVLVVAMEGRSTWRDISVQGPGFNLTMAPGAIKLAAMAKAVVIPCLIGSKFLRPTIRFGEPLPDDIVTHSDRHYLACEHVLRELGPWISSQPEQSAPHLLNAIHFPKKDL